MHRGGATRGDVRIEAGVIRMERLFPGTAKRLWSHLADARKRRLWFCGGDDFTHAGQTAELVLMHSVFADEPTPDAYRQMDEGGFRFEVEITRFEPGRLVAFTWPGEDTISEVEIAIDDADGSPRLRLTHRRIRDAADTADAASGWHAHLDALGDVLRSGRVTGFWSNVSRLQARYRDMLRPTAENRESCSGEPRAPASGHEGEIR